MRVKSNTEQQSTINSGGCRIKNFKEKMICMWFCLYLHIIPLQTRFYNQVHPKTQFIRLFDLNECVDNASKERYVAKTQAGEHKREKNRI